jgi:hypothetical protein
VKFELTKAIPKLLEICFGCGCTHLVDIDPPWERIRVKENVPADFAARQMVGMAAEHEEHRGVTEMPFCNACAPGIRAELHSHGVRALRTMEMLTAGIRRSKTRRKWPWLHQKTARKHTTVMQAVRALRG